MYSLELLKKKKKVQVLLPLLCLKLLGSQKEKSTQRESAIPGNLLLLSLPYSHICGVIATEKETEKGKGLLTVHLQPFRLNGRPPFHTPGVPEGICGRLLQGGECLAQFLLRLSKQTPWHIQKHPRFCHLSGCHYCHYFVSFNFLKNLRQSII